NWLAGGIAHARPLQVFEPRGAPFVTGEPSSASAPGPSWLRCPCRLAAFDYQTSADLRRAVSDAFEAIGDRRRIRQEELDTRRRGVSFERETATDSKFDARLGACIAWQDAVGRARDHGEGSNDRGRHAALRR